MKYSQKFKYLPEIDPIQKDILLKLMSHPTLTFTEIKPDEIESDKFNYHLQYLTKKDIVQKLDNKYFLTKTGKHLVGQFDVKGNIYDQFKYSVHLYVINDGKILLHEWTRYPSLGDVMTITGKTRKGEKIIDTAKRKLFEEAGLIADFRHIGVMRKIKRDCKGELLLDEIFNICYTNKVSGELIEENEFGKNFWCTFDEARKHFNKSINISDDDKKVLENVIKNKLAFFHYEVDFKIREY